MGNLRTAARRFYLTARTPVLVTLGLLRRRLPAPHPARVRRLLAIITGRLDEVALTTPALQDLRDHFHRATITVLAQPGALALLEAHPAVDQLCAIDGWSLPAQLTGPFDLVVDFTQDASLHGAILAARTRARLRIGFAAAGREVFFSTACPAARREQHLIDLHHELLAALGAPPRHSRPSLHVTPDELGEAQIILASLGVASPRVIVHPGGSHRTRPWASERYAQVISRLTERHGAACVVLSDPGEERLARQIGDATPDALLAPSGSIRTQMGLLATSDLFIGPSAGLLHVAGALGIPTVSLIGPSDSLRLAPRGPADRVVGADRSLQAITVSEVVAYAEEALMARLPQLAVR